MSANPYVTIQTGDSILDRIQSQVSSAFAKITGSTDSTTPVTKNNYQISSDDQILVLNTLNVPLTVIGTTSTLVLLMPDATKLRGRIFEFKKIDTSTNAIAFFATANTSINGVTMPQTVEGGSSYSTTASLASGGLFSDGLNWWLIA